MYVYGGHMHASSMPVVVTGHLLRVESLIPPCVSWDSTLVIRLGSEHLTH